MKLLLPLTLALLLTACKSEDPIPDEPKPPTEAQIKAIRSGQIKLLNKKLSLQKKLTKLVASSKIDPSGKMKLILEEKQQALIALQTIKSTHPSLQKLNEELTLWQTHIRSARTSKRPTEIKQAAEKISEVSSKIHTLGKELPAIREAQDRISRSEKETASLRRTLAEKTPEGQALIKELLEIEEALSDPQ